MPGNFKDDDVRIQKTKDALTEAMSKLLDLRNFNRITVNDLCEEAQVGRATFYSHFQDKYDLLKYWLTNSKSILMFKKNAYDDYMKIVNAQVNNNLKIIKNLITDVNDETYELMCDFIFTLFDINAEKTEDGDFSQKYMIFFKFVTGGIMNYLMWLVDNRFPKDLPLMNFCYYNLLLSIQKWYDEQK